MFARQIKRAPFIVAPEWLGHAVDDFQHFAETHDGGEWYDDFMEGGKSTTLDALRHLAETLCERYVANWVGDVEAEGLVVDDDLLYGVIYPTVQKGCLEALTAYLLNPNAKYKVFASKP